MTGAGGNDAPGTAGDARGGGDVLIDLIYIVHPGARAMCAMVDRGDGAEPAMLGPVPAQRPFGPLGEMLAAELPGRFAGAREAASWLTLVHFVNMARGRNATGQDYPFTVGGGGDEPG